MKTIRSLRILLQNSTCRTISLHAAAACYYILLSLLPTIQILLALRSAVDPTLALSYLPASILIWIWSASKAIASLSDGFDAALRIVEHTPFFRKRLISSFSFLLLVISLLFAAVIHIFGAAILRIAIADSPFFTVLQWFIKSRTILTFLYLSITFSVIYYLHPGTNMPFSCCLSGALPTAAACIVFTAVFSVYVNVVVEKQTLLSGLNTAVMCAIWLRFCITIILFGIKLAYLRSEGHRSALKFFLTLLRNLPE